MCGIIGFCEETAVAGLIMGTFLAVGCLIKYSGGMILPTIICQHFFWPVCGHIKQNGAMVSRKMEFYRVDGNRIIEFAGFIL